MRKCSKGFPCGKTCISKTRLCWKNLSTENSKVAETFSQFVNRLVGIYSPQEESSKEVYLNDSIKNSIDSVSQKQIEEREEFRLSRYKEKVGLVGIPDGMTESETAVAVGYTYNDFIDINNYLRGIDTGSNYNVITRTFMKSFEKLPQYTPDNNNNNNELYRGISVIENLENEKYLEYLDSLSEGSIYQDFGFSSTSVNKEIAQGFLSLNWTKGERKFLFVYSNIDDDFKDLTKLNNLGEEEVLIKNGKEFKILKIEDTNIEGADVRIFYL